MAKARGEGGLAEKERVAGISVREKRALTRYLCASFYSPYPNPTPEATPQGPPKHRWKNRFRSESDQGTLEGSGNAGPGCP